MGCLLVFRSITYAQRAQHILESRGFSCSLMRPPVSLGKSCSYGLKLRQGPPKQAVDLLRCYNIACSGVYSMEEGYWREVGL